MATKLTKRTLDAIKPRDKIFIVFDSDIKGFGARIAPSGGVSFVLEYRPGAGGRGVAKRRLTLGKFGAMTLDQARQAALTTLATIRLGSDPQAEKSRQRAALTVAHLIDAFLEDHVTRLKPRTRVSYEDALAKLRKAHGGIKAAALTRAQVAALHRSMADTPYAANWMLAAVSKLYAWTTDQGHLPNIPDDSAPSIDHVVNGDKLACQRIAANLDQFASCLFQRGAFRHIIEPAFAASAGKGAFAQHLAIIQNAFFQVISASLLRFDDDIPICELPNISRADAEPQTKRFGVDLSIAFCQRLNGHKSGSYPNSGVCDGITVETPFRSAKPRHNDCDRRKQIDCYYSFQRLGR